MKGLTIFTPTYNRMNTLKRCYSSLLSQTSNLFEWIIVDDGSTDNTENQVQKWILDNKINIRYFKQENSGKMLAHNKGVENAKYELFVCLDSDDYLVDNTVEKILEIWDNNKSLSCVGIVSLKIFEDFKPVGTDMPKNLKYSTLSDLYNKYKFKGDTMLTYRTEILKEFQFPKIGDEKFIPEAYVYDQIDLIGTLYVSNEKLYICEYLPDGYSANFVKIVKKNPKGYTLYAKQRMKFQKKILVKLKSALQYIIGCILSKEKHFLKLSNNKFITILAVPLAIIIYIIKYSRRKGEDL